MRVMVVLMVVVVLAVTGALFAVGLYNRLVFLRVQCDRAWANIDVLLKQRHDEIPKLVAVCDASMKFERETLERVIAARAAATGASGVAARAQAEGELSSALGRLFAVAEQYPELKTTQQFASLAARVSQLESEIADRREYYNDAVATYHVGLETFPANLIAGPAGFEKRELFKVAAAETADVQLKFTPP